MHLTPRPTSPPSMSLDTAFPTMSDDDDFAKAEALAPPELGRNRSFGHDIFSDFRSGDSSGTIEKLQQQKQSMESLRDHIRRSGHSSVDLPSADGTIPLARQQTLPSREKRMPMRSKSATCNLRLSRSSTVTTSNRSSTMRRVRTDSEENPPTKRNATFTAIAPPDKDTAKRPSKAVVTPVPDVKEQPAGKPRVRRSSRTLSRTTSGNRTSSKSPGPMTRKQSTGERRRKNREKTAARREESAMNRSLSFIDQHKNHDSFNGEESLPSLDLVSKAASAQSGNTHSTSGSSRMSTADSFDQSQASRASSRKSTAAFEESIKSQDSHPSLMGMPVFGEYWTCSCGTNMKSKMKFCGCCGLKRYWTCMECQCDENENAHCFCGSCGVKRQ